MHEGENSLHKFKVCGLVKLFENKYALKEEAKPIVWRKKVVKVPTNGWGDMS